MAGTLTVPGGAPREPTAMTMAPRTSIAAPGLQTSAGYGAPLEPAGTRLPIDRQTPPYGKPVATKDRATQLVDGAKTASVSIQLALRHKPAP